MISWNKKRKIFLIVGSGVWIFFLIVLSIYLYPEKRNDPKLEKKEWSNETIHTAYRNIRGFYNYISLRSKSNFPYNILRKLQIPSATNQRDKLNSEEFNKYVDRNIPFSTGDSNLSKFYTMNSERFETEAAAEWGEFNLYDISIFSSVIII